MKENRCVMCNAIIPEGRMICHECDTVEPSFDTVSTTVLINNFVDITKFVHLVAKCPDDVVAKSGHYSVNAKSIMGLFSLDLSKPLKVEFYGSIPYEVKEGMKKFIVD